MSHKTFMAIDDTGGVIRNLHFIISLFPAYSPTTAIAADTTTAAVYRSSVNVCEKSRNESFLAHEDNIICFFPIWIIRQRNFFFSYILCQTISYYYIVKLLNTLLFSKKVHIMYLPSPQDLQANK